jgi:hypothetical protein
VEIPGCLNRSPSSWNRRLTELAPAIMYIEFGYIISPSIDQEFMTIMAIGIISIMTRNIPEIDIMYPFLKGYIP